jgi:hypothetical protein
LEEEYTLELGGGRLPLVKLKRNVPSVEELTKLSTNSVPLNTSVSSLSHNLKSGESDTTTSNPSSYMKFFGKQTINVIAQKSTFQVLENRGQTML